ncbi:hypothetical protein GGR56DRAFT_660803 [Xylariaceae sp. FL0804]|nr:hypothetical protein GGR56DRAFT_660803 [Xylariaceae sp. FL0804]
MSISKSKKAAKRKRDNDAQLNASNKKRSTPTTTPLSPNFPKSSDGADQREPTSLSAVVSGEELEITVETLRTLAEHSAEANENHGSGPTSI